MSELRYKLKITDAFGNIYNEECDNYEFDWSASREASVLILKDDDSVVGEFFGYQAYSVLAYYPNELATKDIDNVALLRAG